MCLVCSLWARNCHQSIHVETNLFAFSNGPVSTLPTSISDKKLSVTRNRGEFPHLDIEYLKNLTDNIILNAEKLEVSPTKTK